MILDEVFGQDRAVNEIIWWYKRWSAASSTFQKMHDTIFFYSKSEKYTFNQLYQPLAPSTAAIHGDTRRMNVKNESGGLTTIKTEEASKGVQLHDVWEIPFVVAHSQEQVGYPTQKPIELMARIIDAASNPGDLVADFFCGSGSFLAAAEGVRVKKDGNKSVYFSSEPRKWIGTDLGRFAIHTTRKRMIGVQRKAASDGRQFRAFEILNLGGYERAHQVGIDPTLDEEAMALQSAIKREEFVELILSAYGAQRSDQLIPFSGSKGGTAILIGGIDSAVTQDQVQQAIDTALSVGISRVDVLGFEFEMGISPAMSDSAKEQGLTLTVRYIPNEVFDKRASAKGQVKFYEAGYVEAKCEVKNKTLQVSLTDFGVFYRQNDADETAAELRNGNAKVVVDQGQVVRVAKDKKGVITKENLTSNWQDWIDYWAVDFDFASQPETITVIEDGMEVKKRTGKFIFENEWQSFRTKADRSLELTSSPFSYADPGDYSVAVKVIDIFGNDTTRVFKIKVK
jgi:adenine-specific DNA-methyltransferase